MTNSSEDNSGERLRGSGSKSLPNGDYSDQGSENSPGHVSGWYVAYHSHLDKINYSLRGEFGKLNLNIAYNELKLLCPDLLRSDLIARREQKKKDNP